MERNSVEYHTSSWHEISTNYRGNVANKGQIRLILYIYMYKVIRMPGCCKDKNILNAILYQFHELPKNFTPKRCSVMKLKCQFRKYS